MAFLFFGGKRRITKGFFTTSLGNKQTRGIYTFQIDVENGELLFKKHFSTPTDPWYAFNYGRFVGVTYRNRTGSAGDGGLCTYSATAELLALVSRATDEGKTYVHAIANGDVETADKIFAVDYYNGELVTYAISKKKLVKRTGVFKYEGKGDDVVKQGAPYPTYVGILPNSDVVYTTCLGLDQICLFRSNQDGTFEMMKDHTVDLEKGSGPAKVLFNQEGNRAYILNRLNSTVSVYKYDDLKFEHLQTVDSYPSDDDEYDNEASDMAFNFDQDHLYVTNKGHDSVVLFEVNEDGTLEYIDFEDTSPDPVNMLIFNEEGNEWIVVACQKGGILESYRYGSEKGGMIIETKYSCMVNEPICMVPFINNF